MSLRAFGPYNGVLPLPTGQVVAFLRDPASYAFLRYAQYVPAPGVQFSWNRLDPDDGVRLVDLNQFVWAYDDYRPTGAAFNPRIEVISDRIGRWDFPYRIGNQTVETWRRSGIDPQALYDKMRRNHAGLHRAVRVVQSLRTIPQTSTLQALLGDPSMDFSLSSGQQYIGQTANPNYQIIKRAFQRVKRLMNLATNGVIVGDEMVAVISPALAEVMATSGEMQYALSQSRFAKEVVDPTLDDWSLPPRYAGFKLVVEDTPRCFIQQSADGTTVANLVPSEKDYILTEPTVYFTSRTGGLDGQLGFNNFSTVQIFTLNGEAQVKAFNEPKHDLVEGHIEMEDKVVLAAPVSGYALTNCLL